MNAIILPYKNGSRSGEALANALGVRQIRLAGSTIHRQRSKTIINWGNSGRNLPPQGVGDQHEMVNTCYAVSDAADKLRTFNVLGSSSTRIPEYTTEFEIACEWFEEGTKVVERHQLTGHSGAGIRITERLVDLQRAPLYVKYVKKQDEYRVHIMGGQVIDVQRKARRSDVPDEDVNWQVRNHQNGFCYMRENVNPDTDVIVQALNAIEALGLDFGAVDIIWNDHQGKAYVLEVNTACGLEGTTLERYKVAFQELLTLGEVTPLEGYSIGEAEEDDESVDEEVASDETYAIISDEIVTEALQTPSRELQVGDRVVISPSSRYHGEGEANPAGISGTVRNMYLVSEALPIRVQWDNGVINWYNRTDLLLLTEEHIQTPAERPFQLGESVRIAGFEYNSHPRGTVGVVETVREHGCFVRANGTTLFHRNEWLEHAQTPAQPAHSRQELTPETLRVGMRLRALQSNFHGTDLQAGDIVTVRSANNGRFTTTRAFMFNSSHLNGEYFELVDNVVVQEEQGVQEFDMVTPSRPSPSPQVTPPPAPLSKWLVAVDGNVNLEEGVFDTQEEAEMALVSPDFHNMRQLGHDVRVVSL